MPDSLIAQEIAGVVRQAAKLAPNVEIEADSRLVEDLGIDSLDLVGVLLKIQDHFEVEIDDDDVAQLKTIGSLADYIDQRKAA